MGALNYYGAARQRVRCVECRSRVYLDETWCTKCGSRLACVFCGKAGFCAEHDPDEDDVCSSCGSRAADACGSGNACSCGDGDGTAEWVKRASVAKARIGRKAKA